MKFNYILVHLTVYNISNFESPTYENRSNYERL